MINKKIPQTECARINICFETVTKYCLFYPTFYINFALNKNEQKTQKIS